MDVDVGGCSACELSKNEYFSEYDLHMFVGINKANFQIELNEFEGSFDFASVVHWDVGFCGKPRYYIYRSDRFNAVAWYDVECRRGYQINI